MTILVTGASGNVGKEVVKQLKSRQVSFQVGDRHPDKADADRGFKTVQFDFLDPNTYAPAVVGCNAVFLLRPPAIANTKKTLNVFIDVARASGVSQIVFISVAGAGDNPIVPHHAVEQHLRAGLTGWTILRPGFFAQNTAVCGFIRYSKLNNILISDGKAILDRFKNKNCQCS